MVENDQNNDDEYKFTELDPVENESSEEPDFISDDTSPVPKESEGLRGGSNIKRNVLILMGIIGFLTLLYKFLGGMLSGKNSVPEKIHQPIPIVAPASSTQPQQTIIPPESREPVQPAVAQEDNSALQQKISAIETSQQSIHSEVDVMNQQVGNVNNNVNSLNEQITKMNQMLNELATNVAKQTEEINILMDRTKSKIIKHRAVLHHKHVPQTTYYINAVIPGRAWLIGSNGSTLTVREGSRIAGYGIVRLIDSMEGRILTSSGRVIRFEQENS